MPRRSHLLRRAVPAGLALAAVTSLVPASLTTSVAAAAEPLQAEPGSMACPVHGAATFDDSWGAPRSGGRRHQGVDMIADRGTPVLAARAGDAWFKNTRAGGRSVWLTTAEGHKFFYAHLDSWEGESRWVEEGEVIGYVGSTGNAKGPHLHFEVHPAGDPENPFPHTVAACWAPFAEAAADAGAKGETADAEAPTDAESAGAEAADAAEAAATADAEPAAGISWR